MEKKENKNEKLNFETVEKQGGHKKFQNISFHPKENGFGKTILLPFFSGVIGCTLVIGICFGIPSIKNRIMNSSVETTSNGSVSSSSGFVDQVSLSKYSDTSVYAANKVLPSIVGIKVEYSVNTPFQMINQQGEDSSNSASAEGSGIIISQDGYILTNNHIVATSSSSSYYQVSDANKVTVYLYNDETPYEAKIVGKDEQTDLAVIKIEKTNLTAAELANSDSVKVGEFAMAVGNPLGMKSSISCGVISAINREVTDSDGKKFNLIQTDSAINSGNSGGALVNSEGKVIGINTLKLSGTGIEGMGFSIPINSTLDITQQLIQYTKVKRPYIGVTGIDLDEKTAKANNLVQGIYVKAIEDFSSAEKAEIKVGDVITHADGKEVKTMEELNTIKNTHKIGDQMKITVNRNGKTMDLTVTLSEQP